MIGQVSNWLELNFWQLAAHAMSKSPPLSARLLGAAQDFKARHSIEALPLQRAVRPQWLIPLSGWLLGLVLGYWFAFR